MMSQISSSALGEIRLLAVDTSGVDGSLSITEFEPATMDQCWTVRRQENVSWSKKSAHSEIITVHLKNLLKRLSLELNFVTHISVNVGPGSFTGIRVGLSLTRTLAYALARPIVTMDRLSLLAFRRGQANQSSLFAVKAVRDFYYCAGFKKLDSRLITTLAPTSVRDTELASLSAGFGQSFIEVDETIRDFTTSAIDQTQYLAQSPDARMFSSWRQVKPLYIRGSEAEEKLRSVLLKPS